MDQNISTPEKKNRSSTGLLLLVVLLLVSNVVMLWMLMQRNKEVEQTQQQVASITSEKDNVTVMLENMLSSYDTLKTDNEQLTVEMEAQREQIEGLLDQVKRGKYDISKAKKEAETLRKIMKGYVARSIPSTKPTKSLMAKNVGLTQELGEVTGQKEALSTEKQALEGKTPKGRYCIPPRSMRAPCSCAAAAANKWRPTGQEGRNGEVLLHLGPEHGHGLGR
ncbi:MAG: hypothetical protein IPJ10_15605 [Flavobacteriales bacterium]|nr:hypothetical protein [Flavobacteriales bacterium]